MPQWVPISWVYQAPDDDGASISTASLSMPTLTSIGTRASAIVSASASHSVDVSTSINASTGSMLQLMLGSISMSIGASTYIAASTKCQQWCCANISASSRLSGSILVFALINAKHLWAVWCLLHNLFAELPPCPQTGSLHVS